MNSLQQLNTKPGPNPEKLGGLDNFMFDSMLDNFRTGGFLNGPGEAGRGTERTEMCSSVNNENGRPAYDKVDRNQEQGDKKQEMTDSHAGVNATDRRYKTEDINRGAEEQKIDGAAQRAEASEDPQGHETTGVKDKSQTVSGKEENTGQPDAAHGSEGGEGSDTSFAAVLNNNDNESAAGPDAVPHQSENNAEATNDLNAGADTDAIISDLMTGNNDQALKNEAEEFMGRVPVEAQAEDPGTGHDQEVRGEGKGLRTDKLFSGIVKDSKADSADDARTVQQDGTDMDESLKNESVMKDSGAQETRDRAKTAPDMAAGVNKSSGNGEGDATDQSQLDNLLKSMNRDTAGARVEHSESLRTANENAESGQDLDKEFHFQEEMPEGELNFANRNSKILMERSASGFMENTGSESPAKGQAVKPAVRVHAGSGNSNAGALNSNAFIHSSGKTSEGPHNVNGVKTPAFTDIVDKVAYVAKGGNRLGVTLDHAELGRLHINLRLEKGMINVHINAPDRITGEYVENNIQQIVSSLEEQGITVGGFSVALKNSRDNEGFGHWKRNAFSEFNKQKTAFAVEPQVMSGPARTSGMLSIFA